MSRHQVWYVPDSPAEEILVELPDEFDRRPLLDVAQLASAERPGVLVVHYGGWEAGALARAAAQATGMPLVALIESDGPEVVPDHPCFAYLSASLSPAVLTTVLREACARARMKADAREAGTQLEELTAIGIRLSAERNLDALLELILTKGREITRSDAGSLYVVEKTPDGEQCLRFKVAQNDSVRVPFTEFTLAIDAESVAGYVALSGELLRIDDAYALPPGSPFRINPEFDAHVGYRTTSMLVVPMITSEGEVVGVLQLINCKPESGRPLAAPESLHDEVSPFPERYAMLAASLASQAGVAIQNAQLLEELRAALQKLEASQVQLVRAERLGALGEMAAGVAHDFNNLLAVILGRTELLLRRLDDPKLRSWVEAARQAAQDGADTVRRIQEFTRTRTTRSFARVELGAVLREVVELTRPRWKDEAQSHGIQYDVGITGDAPPVAGRPEELREVFANLIANALDAMPAGGRCQMRLISTEDTVEVAVVDTGDGMADDVRQRVFEPFFTTKGPRGNGLGLSVAWGIVARHAGTIDVESAPGAGTTFTVRLPVGRHFTPPADLDAPPPRTRPARILVGDDEPAVRAVLVAMLVEHGHQVVEAKNGPEGLARCAEAQFDVVISDLSMPIMSGWEFAAACHERFPLLPVGLITGWGDRLDPALIERHRVRFVIAKPFDANDILRLLAQVLT